MRRAALLLLLALAAAAPVAAQSPYEPIRQEELGTRLINMPTPVTVGARTLEAIFTHRFHQAIEDSDEHTLWGLDGGADVGIGLTYGVTSHLDLGVYRSSFQEDFELSAKFLVIEQSAAIPMSLAVRAGADLLARDGVEDSTRPFAQALVTTKLGPLTLLAAPTWVRDTPRLRDAFNVPLGLALPLGTKYMIEAEVVPENRDLDESVTAWHVAFSRDIGGHIFEISLGNSRATTVGHSIGGDFPAGYDSGDVRLGFNIVRTFGF